MRPRLEQSAGLDPLGAPGDEPDPADERKVATLKALRVFAFIAVFIYGGGVVVFYLVFFEDNRAACHSAGGIMGRIWCPESVETAGFQVHFAKALGWPAHVLRTPAAPAENFEKAVAAAKRGEDAKSRQLREASARASVSEVQMLLNTLGYKIGTANGIVGPRTRAAIREFQFRDGMQVSGEVTDELVVRLLDSVRERHPKAAGKR